MSDLKLRDALNDEDFPEKRFIKDIKVGDYLYIEKRSITVHGAISASIGEIEDVFPSYFMIRTGETSIKMPKSLSIYSGYSHTITRAFKDKNSVFKQLAPLEKDHMINDISMYLKKEQFGKAKELIDVLMDNKKLLDRLKNKDKMEG